MTSDRPPGKPAAARPDPADAARTAREAKLAEALRANLRRRKAEVRPKGEKPKDGDSA